jgi:hypothetical protein
MSDDPTTGPPDEPEHPADKILGADWMAPGRKWLEEAWDAHEQHELLAERVSERDANGLLKWQLVRVHTEDDWFEYWQRPVDPLDEREPICVCRWPVAREEKAEAEARAIVEEHDDFPR